MTRLPINKLDYSSTLGFVYAVAITPDKELFEKFSKNAKYTESLIVVLKRIKYEARNSDEVKLFANAIRSLSKIISILEDK